MHFKFYMTFDKNCAKNSREARMFATHQMNKIYGEQGGVNGAFFDWFVIGGRWSGELTKLHMNQMIKKQFTDTFEKLYGWWTGKGITEKQRQKQAAQLLKLFDRDAPSDLFWRNTYTHSGYEDDAQIIDKIILEDVKRISKNGKDADFFIDIEEEKPTEKFIGKKWVVVIDYHM